MSSWRPAIKTAAVILAAGLGTRMRSSIPKVLHPVCGLTMIESVLRTTRSLKPERTIIVAGRQLEEIRRSAGSDRLTYALQEPARGTAHALSCAVPSLKGFRGVVLVMNGDTPLLSAQTIGRFLRLHARGRSAVSVLSFVAEKPRGYGRIIRDGGGRISAIVEEKDATARQREITEVNSGVYAINYDALALLAAIKVNAAKGEYYLTDIVAAAYAAGHETRAYCIGAEEDFMGVNTREELHRASRIMRRRILLGFMNNGVSFIDAGSVFVHPDAVIGRDAVIYPNVHIEGRTRIGGGATIYPNVRITDSVIGPGAVVKDASVIEASRIRSGASVGPFAHVRPGTDVGPGARIGNFVELKKARVGRGAKASHLSYLGDAVIGSGVNIGAGTITCNYDGVRKHQTVIGSDAFIGSDTQLVAPVKVGRGAYVGAGSTITRDVPAGALAICRTPQKNILNWARKKTKNHKRKGK